MTLPRRIPRYGTSGPGQAQITLFGSLHALPAEMDWITPEILAAISRSDVFVFEAPTDPPSQDTLNNLIAAHGELPDGQSLRALLPPEAQSDYDNAIARPIFRPASRITSSPGWRRFS